MLPLLDLQTAADENLTVHATWATAHVARARVEHAPDLVLVDSGLPCDTFNVVCRARLTDATVEARAQAALAFFRVTGHPFSWWLAPGCTPTRLPHVLAQLGMTAAENEVAMAVPLSALPRTPPSVVSLAIERVRTRADLAAFAGISAANWDPPDPHVVEYYARAAHALLAAEAPQWLYLGRMDGEPVATAEATVGGGVIGLYNITTHPAFRRRGIGVAMTAAPLTDARAIGLSTGVLQASAAGVGVYERVGFRGFGTVTEFKPAAVHE